MITRIQLQLPNILKVFKRPHILAISCLSFSCGLPFLLFVSTLPIWLKDVNCSLEQISYMFLVTIPYSLKFLWAPAVDQYSVPLLTKILGQRRSWALGSQIFLFIFILLLANTQPEKNIYLTALFSFLAATCAATQDIVLDAYRIERLTKEELGLGTSLSGVGFRLGMLASGAGTIYLANYYSWKTIYIMSALLGLIGMIVIVFVKEPGSAEKEHKLDEIYKIQNNSFFSYVKNVKKSFFNIKRHANWKYIILFVILFKISDAIPNSMSAIFFMDLGFSKLQLGDAKTVGIIMMILGSIVGGIVIDQYAILRSLLICGIVQILAPLSMYGMSLLEDNNIALFIAQGLQSFVCGIGSTAFVTYLSSLCTGGFTATQFSILYSFSSVSRIALSSLSGWAFVYFQCTWSAFFLGTSIASLLFLIPVILLNRSECGA